MRPNFFKSMLENRTPMDFKPVNAPIELEKKLLSTLRSKKAPIPISEVVGNYTSPAVDLLKKYAESWENGSSRQLLERFGTDLIAGKPLSIGKQMWDKFLSILPLDRK